MARARGRRTWVFPDTELPPAGNSLLKGHESIVVLNMNPGAARLVLTLYYSDRDPQILPAIEVQGERVRCIRLDNPRDLGAQVPLETQYAVRVRADRPVVVQYGRLDARQANIAYYTTMGYAV